MVGVIRNPRMRLTVRPSAWLRVRRLMLKRQCVGCGVGRSVRARMLSLLRLLGGVGVMLLLLLNDARRPRVLKVSWRRTLLRMMWMMLYSLESVKGSSSIQCQIECGGGERTRRSVDVAKPSSGDPERQAPPGRWRRWMRMGYRVRHDG